MARIELYGNKHCNPCKMTKQALDRIGCDGIEVRYFDAQLDEERFKAMKIKNIPTLMFFDDDLNLRAVINKGMAESQMRRKLEEIKDDRN